MRIQKYYLHKGYAEETIEDVGLDFIGDIHGCFDQLVELVTLLGYDIGISNGITHPEGRRLVLLGDITDRGPKNLACLRFAKQAISTGHYWVMGNHDNKLFRYLKGNPVILTHGADQTAKEVKGSEFEAKGEELLALVPYKLTIDERVYVAHACPESYVPNVCMMGERNQEDNRVQWWETVSTPGLYLFGHYWFGEIPELVDAGNGVQWSCLDTSCCRGGTLTAMRYPELEFVSVTGLFP